MLLLFTTFTSHTKEIDNLPIVVNLGLSNFTETSLGVSVEVPIVSKLFGSIGTEKFGGCFLELKNYFGAVDNSCCLGGGYETLEYEEKYDEEDQSWVTDLEYGYFFVLGKRH